MDQMQIPGTSARAAPARNASLRGACERTVGLRARLLTGDAEAAQVIRDTFHVLRWEHRGRQIYPLPDGQRTPRRGDR